MVRSSTHNDLTRITTTLTRISAFTFIRINVVLANLLLLASYVNGQLLFVAPFAPSVSFDHIYIFIYVTAFDAAAIVHFSIFVRVFLPPGQARLLSCFALTLRIFLLSFVVAAVVVVCFFSFLYEQTLLVLVPVSLFVVKANPPRAMQGENHGRDSLFFSVPCLCALSFFVSGFCSFYYTRNDALFLSVVVFRNVFHCLGTLHDSPLWMAIWATRWFSCLFSSISYSFKIVRLQE